MATSQVSLMLDVLACEAGFHQTAHAWVAGKDAAGQWRLFQLLAAQIDRCAGDIEGRQILTAKLDRRRPRDRHIDHPIDPAVGAIAGDAPPIPLARSEEHTSELQSQFHLVCRLLLEKKKKQKQTIAIINKKQKKTSKN